LRAITFSILSCGSSVARRARRCRLLPFIPLSVSYPADRRLQDVSGVRPLLIRAKLSVSYPADRRLQVCGRVSLSSLWANFQYPILRIVGCKLARSGGHLAARPAFSILSCGSSVASVAVPPALVGVPVFQYPILRIVGCKL